MDKVCDDLNLSDLSLNEMHNHDDLRVIWFDVENEVTTKLAKMRKYMIFVDSLQTCRNHIDQIQTTGKILLVLTTYVETLSEFNALPQILFIYILNQNDRDRRWLNTALPNKYIGVYTDPVRVIERIRRDMILSYKSDFAFDHCSSEDIDINLSITRVDSYTGRFIWNQLFLSQLVRPADSDMNDLKKKMVEQLRVEYGRDEKRSAEIAQFERESIDGHALRWYTKNDLLHQPINKALRTRDPELICQHRYFLILLYQQLQELYLQQQKTRKSGFQVYRGQLMTELELERLKRHVNQLISINTIMSTTSNRGVADAFGNFDDDNNRQIRVLFQIVIKDPTRPTAYPYADISAFSQYRDEEEILFFPGAIFRLDSVQALSEFRWTIHLTFCHTSAERLHFLIECMKRRLTGSFADEIDRLWKNDDDFHLFDQYYSQLIGHHVSVEELLVGKMGEVVQNWITTFGDHAATIANYEKLLSDPEFMENHVKEKRIILDILIGYNAFHLNRYDQAIDHYRTALQHLPDGQYQMEDEIHCFLGDAWKAQNQFLQALTAYGRAIRMFCVCQMKGRYRARLYRKISELCRQQGIESIAQSFERAAKRWDSPVPKIYALDRLKPLEHHLDQLKMVCSGPTFDIAMNYFNTVLCHIKNGQFSEALNLLKCAEPLLKVFLPNGHRFMHLFATVYETYAYLYLRLNNYLDALIFAKRAIDIRAGFHEAKRFSHLSDE